MHKFTDSQLIGLTSSLLLDYLKNMDKYYVKIDDITVEDIRIYCRDWIRENLKDE